LSVYADTSVFVSFYINDSHSAEVRKGMATYPDLRFTPLHRAEWTHAIEQHVFRGFLSTDGARKIYDHFAIDSRNNLWVEAEIPRRVFELTVELARRHAARIGTRTLDTLHVACALELKAKTFWTFDERQRKLAKAVGLKTA